MNKGQQRNNPTSGKDNPVEQMEQPHAVIEHMRREFLKKEEDLGKRELALKSEKTAFEKTKQEEIKASSDKEKLYIEKDKQLKNRENDLLVKLNALEDQKEELRKRELKLKEAEIKRDHGFSDQRKTLDDELHLKRQDLEKEIAKKRTELLGFLEIEIKTERTNRLKSLEEELKIERKNVNDDLVNQKKEFEGLKETTQKTLKEQNEKLKTLRLELEKKTDDIELKSKLLLAKEDKLVDWRKSIEKEVNNATAERKKSFEEKENSLIEECQRLRNSISSADQAFGLYEELKRKLGDDAPEKVLLKLKTQEEDLKQLREELLERPTKEMADVFDTLKKENKRLEEECKRLQDEKNELHNKYNDQNEIKLKLKELEDENKSLKKRHDSIEAENSRLNADLRRFNSAYEREDERDARIRDIETPYIKKPRQSLESCEIDEIDWLKNISEKCIGFDLEFHSRILKSFHTALKTAEWSPITILAGVSGTGKSILPKYYSHFGGIHFLNLSVQSNWDSPESMLGYFNSIDNRFDAQPVLRLLVQTQKPIFDEEGVKQNIESIQQLISVNPDDYINFVKNNDDHRKHRKWLEENKIDENIIREVLKLQLSKYPGLNRSVCMILMDEMNLAHPELYFSEFLSKLEDRRDYKGDKVPSLDVKLGAGIEPFPLKLGRNVLWTGTMNQDETTKSLSDKVLDRSIIIFFPRPTKLKRRTTLKTLDETNAGPLLPRKVWQDWCCRDTKEMFKGDSIDEYKKFLEDINSSLANVGRALGHRVWQSIEYYMANYPDVRQCAIWKKVKDDDGNENNEFKGWKDDMGPSLNKAMRTAFEDQLVQKVMPKLRGIETRGRGRGKTECLDHILRKLETNEQGIGSALVGDFKLACELGYGQFIWNSADYILKDEENVDSINGNSESQSQSEKQKEG